jgi:TonB-dependent receptor
VGGLVQMNTIDFPQGFSVRLNAGMAANSQITNAADQFLGTKPGPTDWLGIDGTWRDAPAIPGTNEFAALRSLVNAGDPAAIEQYNNIGRGFNNELLSTKISTAPFAGKGGVTLTNVWDVGEESRLGLVASLNYGNGYGENRILRRGIASNGDLLFDYNGRVTTSSTNLGFLANIAYKFGTQSTISWKNTYALNSDDEGVYQFGREIAQTQIRKNLSFEFQEKRLLATTLSGEHNIAVASNLLIDWKAGYSQSRRDQPDFRRFSYRKGVFAGDEVPLEIEIPSSGFTTQGLGSAAGRFYSVLNEYARNLNLNATLSVDAIKFKVGGLHESKNRDFSSRSYTYVQSQQSNIDYSLITFPVDSTKIPDPTALFADENLGVNGLGISEDSRRRDSYTAQEKLWAGYAMVDLPFTLGSIGARVIAGARVESSLQELQSYTSSDDPVNVNLDITDILPSINLVVTPFENFNLRAAATQTLTRPSLREFAPFAFFDFQTQSTTQGNPALTRALIQNYDFRAEWFPGPGEVLSASVFYKNFKNAIEETVFPSTSELIRSFANATSDATNYGLELEARKNLGFIAKDLQFLVLSANVALINSSITVLQGVVTDQRRMWGQSPYTVNASISYFNPDWGTQLSLGYNIAGRRIIQVAQIGVYQIPDEFKEDGPHVYENPRDVIDIGITQAFGNLEIKAGLKDLLNQELVWEQLGRVVASNLRGRGYSLGVTYKFR